MRTLLRFVFSALGILVAAKFVPGVHAERFSDLVAVAVILGLVNATLGSLLKFLALVPLVCSFGCLSLFINGLLFWLVGNLSSVLGLRFRVDGFWAGFWGALVSSLVAWLVEVILIGKERKGPPSGGFREEGPRPIKIVE